jgi:hypothetical protein
MRDNESLITSEMLLKGEYFFSKSCKNSKKKIFKHFWVLNFSSRSRASHQPQRFLPSRRSREKSRG